MFGSAYTYEDQPRLSARALEVAARTGAPIIRVFSGWRTVDPGALTATIAAELRGLADRAQAQGVTIGLENEHACNVGTGAEAARMLAAVEHPALGLIWDPANASILGEEPFPDGYAALPPRRVIHVHAKDCMVNGHSPTWGPLGEMAIDWVGADRRAGPRRLRRRDQPRNALARRQREPARRQHDLRQEPARPGRGAALSGRVRGGLRSE